MTGFLVLARFEMEDVPMAFFQGEAEARDFIGAATTKMVCDAAWLVYELDSKHPLVLSIVPFLRGLPTGAFVVVRDLEAERMVA